MERSLLIVLVSLAGCSFDTSTAATPVDPRDPTDPDGGAAQPGDGGQDDPDGGQPNSDSDGDGVVDDNDNCIDTFNTAQHDEDADGVGDLCDNCPQIANAAQENLGETQNGQVADAIGDLCDPRPADAGDVQFFFLGFNSSSEIADFEKAGAQDYAVVDGMLQSRSNSDLGLIWKNNLNAADATIEAKLTYRNVATGATGYQFRGISLLGMFERDGNFGSGLGCGEMHDTGYSPNAFQNSSRYTGGGFNNGPSGFEASVVEGRTVTYRATTSGGNAASCRADTVSWDTPISADYSGTGVAISNWGSGMDMEYLILYTR